MHRIHESFFKYFKTQLNNLSISFLFIFIANIGIGQSPGELYKEVGYTEIPPKYCDLSNVVNETSGVIFYDNNVWTFNDSNGEPEIYRIDGKTGEVIQTVKLKGRDNKDWEDIAHDENFIYIGDFGNNRGNRTDLAIYKVDKSLIGKEKIAEVPSEVISFVYNDQHDFTTDKRSNNYDCESLICYGDSLIIFTKNWGDSRTRLYKMPKISGSYQLDPVSTYDLYGLATGADYHKGKNALILIGYWNYMPFLYYFPDFNGHQLGDKTACRIGLSGLQGAQTEGICWLDDEHVLFSTEQTENFNQAIFQFNPIDVVNQFE